MAIFSTWTWVGWSQNVSIQNVSILDCIYSGNNWSYKTCKVPVKSLPPTNQHPTFTGPMSFLSPNEQCLSTEGKRHQIKNGKVHHTPLQGNGPRMSPFWILLELRMTEVVSGDNWNYKTCKAPVKSVTFRRASPPFGQYQIILLGDRGTLVSMTCPRLHSGFKPTTCWSQVRLPDHSATESKQPLSSCRSLKTRPVPQRSPKEPPVRNVRARFFTGRMFFMSYNQQCQSKEWIKRVKHKSTYNL